MLTAARDERKPQDLPQGQEDMTEYFVAGGVYLDLQGNGRFTLRAPTARNRPT
jgi:hypothetical protein